MNFQGNETLRQDIAALNNEMDKLKQHMDSLEKKYRWGSDNLAHALAGQALRIANGTFTRAHQQIWELDIIFLD